MLSSNEDDVLTADDDVTIIPGNTLAEGGRGIINHPATLAAIMPNTNNVQ